MTSAIQEILVLGVHSFEDASHRTGIQAIASGLADQGLSVDYVTVPSSPLDLFSVVRRGRFGRAWLRSRPVYPAGSGVSFREYTFRSLAPVHSLFVPGRCAVPALFGWGASLLGRKRYDVCIHDVGPSMVYLPRVLARHTVLRLNDHPGGFASLPGYLQGELEARLGRGGYDQVWAVSAPLAEYAAGFTQEERVHVVPNGLDGVRLDSGPAALAGDRERRCVYLGSRVPWLDVELVLAAAELLPGWEFHFVGGGYDRCRSQGNVSFLPPVAHVGAGALLQEYAVGLLPYRDVAGRMEYVHRPLKFYEYYAAGLGVAAADVGGLRDGLGGMASYGTTAESFARAIVESVGVAQDVDAGDRRAFLQGNTWTARVRECLGLLAELPATD